MFSYHRDMARVCSVPTNALVFFKIILHYSFADFDLLEITPATYPPIYLTVPIIPSSTAITYFTHVLCEKMAAVSQKTFSSDFFMNEKSCICIRISLNLFLKV